MRAMPNGLRFCRHVGGSCRIRVRAGGQDGLDDSHGVLNTGFAADGEPSFQCDLAVVAELAAVDHDGPCGRGLGGVLAEPLCGRPSGRRSRPGRPGALGLAGGGPVRPRGLAAEGAAADALADPGVQDAGDAPRPGQVPGSDCRAEEIACRMPRWSALARFRRRVSEADSPAPSRSSTSASTAIGSRGSGLGLRVGRAHSASSRHV